MISATRDKARIDSGDPWQGLPRCGQWHWTRPPAQPPALTQVKSGGRTRDKTRTIRVLSTYDHSREHSRQFHRPTVALLHLLLRLFPSESVISPLHLRLWMPESGPRVHCYLQLFLLLPVWPGEWLRLQLEQPRIWLGHSSRARAVHSLIVPVRVLQAFQACSFLGAEQVTIMWSEDLSIGDAGRASGEGRSKISSVCMSAWPLTQSGRGGGDRRKETIISVCCFRCQDQQ